MRFTIRCVALLLTCALVAGIAASQATGPTATAPATGPSAPSTGPTTAKASLPEDVMEKISEQLVRPQSKEDMVKQMEKVLELGADAEKKHPQAANLYEVQYLMMRAANMLADLKEDKSYNKTMLEVGKRLIDSDAPVQMRVQAEAICISARAEGPKAELAGKALSDQISAMVAKYEKTEGYKDSLAFGGLLAAEHGLKDLKIDMAKKLEGKFGEEPGVDRVLARIRRPGEGEAFKAQLTKLDGGKLSLPDDLKGKVVVIDFWATWCGPCIESLPELKKIYAQFKDKGVEFVGVSLDKPDQKDEVAKFVKENAMSWVHTYSGKFWDDPTAKAYAVTGIPSVWVIGKDGMIISDNARETLAEILAKATGTTTTAPATAEAK